MLRRHNVFPGPHNHMCSTQLERKCRWILLLLLLFRLRLLFFPFYFPFSPSYRPKFYKCMISPPLPLLLTHRPMANPLQTTMIPKSTTTGYITITAVPTTTGIVTDTRPMPNVTMTNAAAGAPAFHRGVNIGGWLGALVLGYLIM